jgi:hypothetical protein
LDSTHPLAAINAATNEGDTPDNLFYTAASVAANSLFFGDGPAPRLIGQRMDQFLVELKRRMHPAQWRAFKRDQIRARTELNQGLPAIARVPIVFQGHENSNYNHRAFLPIVVQDYRPQQDAPNWYNLSVLYLNVTTATVKERDDQYDEEYYVCKLDQWSDRRLAPLKAYEPIRIFLSYRSDNRPKVEAICRQLDSFKPYVAPFMDTSIQGGDDWLATLERSLEQSELCFLFLDDKDVGPGQKEEVRSLIAQLFARTERTIVVPVRLRPVELPFFLRTKQWVEFGNLTERKLQEILSHSFPRRCPDDWAPGGEPPPPVYPGPDP